MPKPELKDLLAALPADFKFKVGEEELGVDVLRGTIDETVNGFTSGRTELERQLNETKAERDAAIAAGSTRQEQRTEDPRQKLFDRLAAAFNGDTSEYDFSDPYSTALLKKLDGLVGDRTKGIVTEEKFNQLTTGVTGLLAMVARDQLGRAFSAKEWPEGYSLERASKEALARGFTDRTTGLPDIDTFNDLLMAPTREQKKSEKARLDGIEEGKRLAREEAQSNMTRKGRLSLLQPPRTGAIGDKKTGGDKAPRSISEAVDNMVITDEDVARSVGMVRQGG